MTHEEALNQAAINNSWKSWDELIEHHKQFNGEFLISEISGYYKEATELYARSKWEEACSHYHRILIDHLNNDEIKFVAGKPEFKI